MALFADNPAAKNEVVKWLTSYAARHGQSDPRHGEGKVWLPAGDTSSYYALYRQDMENVLPKREGNRTTRKRSASVASGSSADARAYAPASTRAQWRTECATVVDLEFFSNTWQIECPWLVIRGDASSSSSPDAEAYLSASQGMANASSDAPANVLKRPAGRRVVKLPKEPVQYVAETESEIPPPPKEWSQPLPTSQPQ